MPHQDARYPNEKMRAAMGILMLRHLPPQKSVDHAMLEFVRALDNGEPAAIPAWARESVDAVLEVIPLDAEAREKWLATASMDDLSAACDALLDVYAATEFEHGRQSR